MTRAGWSKPSRSIRPSSGGRPRRAISQPDPGTVSRTKPITRTSAPPRRSSLVSKTKIASPASSEMTPPTANLRSRRERFIVAALGGGRRDVPAALADAHGLDAVLAHRLHADRVAVVVDRVAALGQPPELAEHEAADRVVGVGVDRQLEPGAGQGAERHVPANEPVAVGEPPHRAPERIRLVVDLADDLLDD